MKIFRQFCLICLFYIIGELISSGIIKIFPMLFIPGALIGMILLFICLYFKIIKIQSVDTVGNFFINNMAFFFIPAAVSIVSYFDLLKMIIIQVILITFFSFVLTFTAVALSIKILIYILNKNKKNEGDLYE